MSAEHTYNRAVGLSKWERHFQAHGGNLRHLKNKKGWKRTHLVLCPDCGREDSSVVRVNSPTPTDPMEFVKVIVQSCGCAEMARQLQQTTRSEESFWKGHASPAPQPPPLSYADVMQSITEAMKKAASSYDVETPGRSKKGEMFW